MSSIDKNRVGVCSWSLQPEEPTQLSQLAAETGVSGVQLALDPLRTGAWNTARTTDALESLGLRVFSGMMSTIGEDYSSLEAIAKTGGVRLDEHWEANLAAAKANAKLAQELGLDLISFHAGFLPEEPSDPERGKMLERLRAIVDVFADHGVRTAFETGQETAATLLEVMTELDRKTAGVNFDPANMILYDKGEPVAALDALAPHVFQIHIKDATRTKTPGTWGEEVVVGTGEVHWPGFFETVSKHSLEVNFMIEREAGTHRVADVQTALAFLNSDAVGGA